MPSCAWPFIPHSPHTLQVNAEPSPASSLSKVLLPTQLQVRAGYLGVGEVVLALWLVCSWG